MYLCIACVYVGAYMVQGIYQRITCSFGRVAFLFADLRRKVVFFHQAGPGDGTGLSNFVGSAFTFWATGPKMVFQIFSM